MVNKTTTHAKPIYNCKDAAHEMARRWLSADKTSDAGKALKAAAKFYDIMRPRS